MNPAVSSRKKAVILGALVGGFVFWWYFLPFPWLGAVLWGYLSALLPSIFSAQGEWSGCGGLSL